MGLYRDNPTASAPTNFYNPQYYGMGALFGGAVNPWSTTNSMWADSNQVGYLQGQAAYHPLDSTLGFAQRYALPAGLAYGAWKASQAWQVESENRIYRGVSRGAFRARQGLTRLWSGREAAESMVWEAPKSPWLVAAGDRFGAGVTRGAFNAIGLSGIAEGAGDVGGFIGGLAGWAAPMVIAQAGMAVINRGFFKPFGHMRALQNDLGQSTAGISYMGMNMGNPMTGKGLGPEVSAGLSSSGIEYGAGSRFFTQGMAAQVISGAFSDGIMNNVNTQSGMKQKLESMFKTVKTVAEVMSNTDTQQALKLIANFQQAGGDIRGGQIGRSIKNLSFLASQAGISPQQMYQSGFEPGAIAGSSAGIVPINAGLYSSTVEAGMMAARQAGAISNSVYAQMGGPTGAAQTLTGGAIQAVQSPFYTVEGVGKYMYGADNTNFASTVGVVGGAIARNPFQAMGAISMNQPFIESKMLADVDSRSTLRRDMLSLHLPRQAFFNSSGHMTEAGVYNYFKMQGLDSQQAAAQARFVEAQSTHSAQAQRYLAKANQETVNREKRMRQNWETFGGILHGPAMALFALNKAVVSGGAGSLERGWSDVSNWVSKEWTEAQYGDDVYEREQQAKVAAEAIRTGQTKQYNAGGKIITGLSFTKPLSTSGLAWGLNPVDEVESFFSGPGLGKSSNRQLSLAEARAKTAYSKGDPFVTANLLKMKEDPKNADKYAQLIGEHLGTPFTKAEAAAFAKEASVKVGSGMSQTIASYSEMKKASGNAGWWGYSLSKSKYDHAASEAANGNDAPMRNLMRRLHLDDKDIKGPRMTRAQAGTMVMLGEHASAVTDTQQVDIAKLHSLAERASKLKGGIDSLPTAEISRVMKLEQQAGFHVKNAGNALDLLSSKLLKEKFAELAKGTPMHGATIADVVSPGTLKGKAAIDKGQVEQGTPASARDMVVNATNVKIVQGPAAPGKVYKPTTPSVMGSSSPDMDQDAGQH